MRQEEVATTSASVPGGLNEALAYWRLRTPGAALLRRYILVALYLGYRLRTYLHFVIPMA